MVSDYKQAQRECATACVDFSPSLLFAMSGSAHPPSSTFADETVASSVRGVPSLCRATIDVDTAETREQEDRGGETDGDQNVSAALLLFVPPPAQPIKKLAPQTNDLQLSNFSGATDAAGETGRPSFQPTREGSGTPRVRMDSPETSTLTGTATLDAMPHCACVPGLQAATEAPGQSLALGAVSRDMRLTSSPLSAHDVDGTFGLFSQARPSGELVEQGEGIDKGGGGIEQPNRATIQDLMRAVRGNSVEQCRILRGQEAAPATSPVTEWEDKSRTAVPLQHEAELASRGLTRPMRYRGGEVPVEACAAATLREVKLGAATPQANQGTPGRASQERGATFVRLSNEPADFGDLPGDNLAKVAALGCHSRTQGSSLLNAAGIANRASESDTWSNVHCSSSTESQVSLHVSVPFGSVGPASKEVSSVGRVDLTLEGTSGAVGPLVENSSRQETSRSGASFNGSPRVSSETVVTTDRVIERRAHPKSGERNRSDNNAGAETQQERPLTEPRSSLAADHSQPTDEAAPPMHSKLNGGVGEALLPQEQQLRESQAPEAPLRANARDVAAHYMPDDQGLRMHKLQVPRLSPTELHMTLRTPGEGQLELRAFVREGRFGASLRVDNPDLRDALVTHLPVLENALSQQSLEVGQLAIAGREPFGPDTGSGRQSHQHHEQRLWPQVRGDEERDAPVTDLAVNELVESRANLNVHA